MSKWKARIDAYKGINFTPYINDGTVLGHYMIDEPNDPANWNGQPVSPATLEEMAKYSKSIWPDMPTVVRVEPGYLASNHKYLDAAWAQYLNRRGSVQDYIKRNVADAQARHVSLIVGMNVLKGGVPNLTPMTAAEVESWGSALLSSGYPCAFISWNWDRSYASSSGIGSAMDALRRQAQNRPTKSCRAAHPVEARLRRRLHRRRPRHRPHRLPRRRRRVQVCRSARTACRTNSWRHSAARFVASAPMRRWRRCPRPGRRAPASSSASAATR